MFLVHVSCNMGGSDHFPQICFFIFGHPSQTELNKMCFVTFQADCVLYDEYSFSHTSRNCFFKSSLWLTLSVSSPLAQSYKEQTSLEAFFDHGFFRELTNKNRVFKRTNVCLCAYLCVLSKGVF